MRRRDVRVVIAVVAAGFSLAATTGCGPDKPKPELPRATLPIGTSIAIAPPINVSGSSDVDTLKVADLMASELSTIPGIGVIGVNRVLAVMAEQGQRQVMSAEHALALCDRLNADCIVVFAITEYNAYTPVVGIVAELYGKTGNHAVQLDPVAMSQMVRPFVIPPDERAPKPWAQVQKTFNASHEAIQKEVKEYADGRSANKTPLGWKRYLASQQDYLRFCCFSIARDLVQ
ncbi:MAG: hypothetical protein FWC56_05335 [Phycisphaerae bacterium]|nr:hypothetical protein [Phycisphaerae bacterium]